METRKAKYFNLKTNRKIRPSSCDSSYLIEALVFHLPESLQDSGIFEILVCHSSPSPRTRQ